MNIKRENNVKKDPFISTAKPNFPPIIMPFKFFGRSKRVSNIDRNEAANYAGMYANIIFPRKSELKLIWQRT